MDSAEPNSSQDRPAISYPPNAVHLVHTNQQLTMQLSQMADQKASILMGATFVVFTLAIGQARAGAGALAMPLTILATFSFLSALLAVSAVLPRVGKAPPVVYKDGKDHSNILFRSDEHTSELQSLMRISYAVFCLKKKKLSYN